MVIQEVMSKKDEFDFLRFPIQLYKNNAYWIRPLDKDINAIFDPQVNKLFSHGACCRWLLVDGKKIIGRVAAFVDYDTCDKGANEQPTGGMGFFECIDHQEASFLLFDQCKHWLQSKGMEAMDGPVNFGHRNQWWGLLVDGFSQDPNYQCNYHWAYYQKFFEAYHFQVYFKQFTFSRKILGALSKKILDRIKLFSINEDYEVRQLRTSEMPKLAEYIRTVYNGAWAKFSESAPLSLHEMEFIVKQMKPILDINLLVFAFYKGDPVGFHISIPEINPILKHVNGKMNWKGKLIFLWHVLRKNNRKVLGILFGVIPAHQGKGLDRAMVAEMYKHFNESKRKCYEDYELNWIGDFNELMVNLATRNLNMKISKTHYTYRKLFDENKPFIRYPMQLKSL